MFEGWSTPMQVILLMGFMTISTTVWLLPGLIAARRKHSQTTVIWLLLLFGAWFLLPWLYALYFAFQEDNRDRVLDDDGEVRDYRRRRLVQLQAERDNWTIDPMKVRQQELADQATRYLR
jgi:hypothetical protein